jgi:hypothetical protein
MQKKNRNGFTGTKPEFLRPQPTLNSRKKSRSIHPITHIGKQKENILRQSSNHEKFIFVIVFAIKQPVKAADEL